jgi:hypothetical protein
MEEIWKVIPGFTGYEVSNLGRIRSLNYKRTGRVKVLKPAVTGGYYKTMLKSDEGEYKTVSVHVIEVLTFKGERPGSNYDIDHKDGNSLNNNLDNLWYIPHSENVRRGYIYGKAKPQKGLNNGMGKYSDDFVKEVRRYVATQKKLKGVNYGRADVADRFGINVNTLKHILRTDNKGRRL